MKFGTDEQQQKYLPQMATGEIRAAFSLSEPELGSDVQAIKTLGARRPTTATRRSTARRCGSPTACCSALVFVLVKTDPRGRAAATRA